MVFPLSSRRNVTVFSRAFVPLCLAGVKKPRVLRFFSILTNSRVGGGVWDATTGGGEIGGVLFTEGMISALEGGIQDVVDICGDTCLIVVWRRNRVSLLLERKELRDGVLIQSTGNLFSGTGGL